MKFDTLTFRAARRRTSAIVAVAAVALCALGPDLVVRAGCDDGIPGTCIDTTADAVARQTDPGATLMFDISAHRLPDLLSIRLVAFFPFDASVDLFDGVADTSSSSADFFRLDLVLNGLVNPGGSVDPTSYAPFVYGDHPIYGFVELDVDDDPDTGGELVAPQHRYLGNAVRFGGMIADEELQDRVAVDASAFDGNFIATPQVERSGEEFHLALVGGEFLPADIDEITGNGDAVFEAGEKWRITARFFHRAHGFAPFSFIEGGLHPGEYEPDTTLQFAHDLATDQTVISLVFPQTQVGAAMISGGIVEELNRDPTDQASVEEGLFDLVLSADYLTKFPTGDPEEAILVGWRNRDPESYLAPHGWEATALLGSAYTESSPSGVYYLWSDIYPDVLRGDVDGDEQVDPDDGDLIAGYIASMDAVDGVVDGAVVIDGFARDFSLFDVNHDGVVSAFDIVASEADGDDDDDDDIDLADVAAFQRCFMVDSTQVLDCVSMDLDLDGTVGLNDLNMFAQRLTGPK